MSFYVLDENNNKIPALDQEGVLNAIETAIKDGSLANLVANEAFVTKLKCCVTGGTNQVAFVTQQKYNELKAANQLKENTLYHITDDPTAEELDAILQALSDTVTHLVTNCGNNTNNINNIYTFLNKVIPQRLTVDDSINGISLTKSGLYVFHYTDVATGLTVKNVFLSFDSANGRLPYLGDDLEVRGDNGEYLYVKPKSLSTYRLLNGYLITQY